MNIKILEKIVMDCPLISRDIQRVAILLLETVKETFLRQAEHGAYVEPGSAMRFVGQRQQVQDSHSITVTDPVLFVAFPFVELDSSRHHPGLGERDEYHPRTLLQNLYGFDVLTSRGKQQVIHKMSVCSQSSDTLYVKQLWCLLIGSDILITMSSQPSEKLLGETIIKRTDSPRQPLRIEVIDTYGSQYSMSVSLKTTWVDFFRHVMLTIYGNLTKIMDFELVDETTEVVTADRWVEIANQVKEYNSRRRKPSVGKIHYLDCEDCKAAKPYSSAESALEHIHAKHMECPHSESGRPYDDPCYAWLHRIWHDGYPMRSSQDGLLGIVEDFIEELSDVSMYVRELLNLTARDSSTADTPPLTINTIHIFQQIVKIFVFRSKQLSLINRRRSIAAEDSSGNTRLIQRIDRKIEELLSLEIDANDRIIDLSESAKKDIFMSGIGSASEVPQSETVRVQFLALALMSCYQRPLLQSLYAGSSYAKDTLLQLYRDYTSRLHFQANNRPRKRVFLDIHGLDEELQALDKLLGSQEICLYNTLTLIDPLTSRYTTKTRLREFRAELPYGNNMLRGIINRRREIENLATRLRILKDQVKQTIEILEEDHGKAIRVFTVVTLFFLPLSFVSSFLGMNTVDVRDTEYSQRIFWLTGVPVTVAVLSVAFAYGYKGEEIIDWISHVLQDKRRRTPTWGENRDAGDRTSLEAGWRDLVPMTEAKQHTARRRRLTTLMRGRSSEPRGDIENLQMEDPGGKVWIERRNTDDSLAPIRRRG
ncbi:hypothetical protein A9Z42_0068720 [Trichoderma parareesei]|uniref:Uncharacterized protein n=1 Tax=Trichoderma parareesei TaxID=858221 RepID=A0A2H2ZVX9_TRIPA|nr:hypothetical protein A9Z42_0068720 [Trichoderma parareesei]